MRWRPPASYPWRSASRINARRSWCGTDGSPARLPEPSSGRTAGPHRAARRSRRTQRRWQRSPVSPSIRTFPRPSSNGSSRTHGWRERARRGEIAMGTIDTWLIWNLTGGRTYASDPTNASRTSLYDIGTGQWSRTMCELFDVPLEALPEVRTSAGDFGVADAGLVGGPAGVSVPIAGVAGDQQAALFGHGCCAAGEGKNTYGTGAFLLLHAGPHRPVAAGGDGLLTTVACDARGGPAYALEASIFIAGAAIQWLRDGLGIVARAADTEADGEECGLDRRRRVRARAHRAGGAPLGAQRARDYRRSDPRHHKGPPRSRGPRGHGVRNRRSPGHHAASDGQSGRTRSRDCEWTAARRRTTGSCSSRRTCWACRSSDRT